MGHDPAFPAAPYDDVICAERAKSFEEWVERMRGAGPPTDGDVTITADGRRLDSKEAVLAWFAEDNALRAAESSPEEPTPS